LRMAAAARAALLAAALLPQAVLPYLLFLHIIGAQMQARQRSRVPLGVSPWSEAQRSRAMALKCFHFFHECLGKS
jgi:hypothetical protein